MKPSARLCTIALLCTGFSSCYLSKQALYQNDLINRRVSIKELVRSPTTAPELKKKLLFLREILSFSESLGLNSEGAYQYYIETPNAAVSYLVMAADPAKLERKTWWFPIVGSVPYLGFFNLEDRKAEAKRLMDGGLDVHETTAAAFSSLGWFEDPIYRPMLQYRSDMDFAHLIFHELTHRSVWIPNDSAFNEGLAEFVADKALAEFRKERKKEEALPSSDFLDDEIFAAWLTELKKELNEIFSDDSLTLQQKVDRKRVCYRKFTTKLWPKFNSSQYESLSKKEWNNAMLLSITLYISEKKEASLLYEKMKAIDLRDFLSRVSHARSHI